MSNKARTSLTLSELALKLAKERREALDYDSVSEYIEFLILEDARQKRAHSVIRGEGEVRYETVPEVRSADRVDYTTTPSFLPLVAEPGQAEPRDWDESSD